MSEPADNSAEVKEQAERILERWGPAVPEDSPFAPRARVVTPAERMADLQARVQALEQRSVIQTRYADMLSGRIDTWEKPAKQVQADLSLLAQGLIEVRDRLAELEPAAPALNDWKLLFETVNRHSGETHALRERLAQLEPAVKLLKDLHPGPERWTMGPAPDLAGPEWAERHQVRSPVASPRWTNALPTQPGFYWCRFPESDTKEPVKVFQFGGFLHLALIADHRTRTLTRLEVGYEWYGPVEPPE